MAIIEESMNCRFCADLCKLYEAGFADLCPQNQPEAQPDMYTTAVVIDPRTHRKVMKTLCLVRRDGKEFPDGKTQFPARFPPKPDELTGQLVERSRGEHSRSYAQMLAHDRMVKEKTVKFTRSTVSAWIPEEGLESKHELLTTIQDYMVYRQEDEPEEIQEFKSSRTRVTLVFNGYRTVRQLREVRRVSTTVFRKYLERLWVWMGSEFRYDLVAKVERVTAWEPIPVYENVQVPYYSPVPTQELISARAPEVTRKLRRKWFDRSNLEKTRARDQRRIDDLEYAIKTGKVHFR